MPRLGNGKICHVALPAPDVEASSTFYENVFGWRMNRDGHGVTFDDGVDEVSGHFVPDRGPTEPGLLLYIWVDDLDAATERVQAAGGDIVQTVGADPGELTVLFRDPGGNVLGIYQEPTVDS